MYIVPTIDDDLYLLILIDLYNCVHDLSRKHMANGVGVVNKHGEQKCAIYSARGMCSAIRSIVFRRFLLLNLLCLQHIQMPKSQDPAIFMLTDRRNPAITLPLAHAG